MKTIIKIVFGILLITVCFNASRAVLGNYQFEDAVHEVLLFDPRASDEVLTAKVMKLADQYSVPLEKNDVTIQQIGQDVTIKMSYTETVMLVPGVYSREWTFTPSASTRLLTGSRNR